MPSRFILSLHWIGVFLSAAGLSLCTATLCAATVSPGVGTERNLAELTRVWQQEFAAPPLLGASPPPSFQSTGYAPNAHLRNDEPHPAVARIVVPEAGATSYGSGTLIDVRDQFGLVVTNWHVVRDGVGPVEVVFPCGFRSKARALKVDADWDLAALVIWRPPLEPVKLSAVAPQPGDQLTICGYGQGPYRSATGRCTQYYAPRKNFPLQMVELDVEARQGDSGGPIFNERGELAGVLFGAGHGTTLGSFGGRVESFLASLAPDIGQAADDALVSYAKPSGRDDVICRDGVCYPADSSPPAKDQSPVTQDDDWQSPSAQLAGMWAAANGAEAKPTAMESPVVNESANQWKPAPKPQWFEQTKSALAAIGLLTLGMLLLKAVC